MTTNSEFISIPELAGKLGISRIAVYKQVKSGRIKATKIGRNFVIAKSDIPGLNSRDLNEKQKIIIDEGVRKTVKEYGETLKLLGAE